jgi:hypothetical protein
MPDRYGATVRYNTDRAKVLSYDFGLSLNPEDLGSMRINTNAGVAWRPNDRFSVDLQVSYEDREALLVHQGNGNYTSFEAHQWAPTLEMNYFITAKQQLRFSTQWTGLKAFEDTFYKVNPAVVEPLHPVLKPNTEADDFVISRLTFQARYRWEIAPLSDLFIVYTRGANLPRDSLFEFPDLFERSWNDPVVSQVAVKLRYRLGS